MVQAVRYGFTPPEPKPDADLHGHMCTTFVDALRACLKDGGWATKDKEQEVRGRSAFLAGVHGRLFKVQSDYQVPSMRTAVLRPRAAVRTSCSGPCTPRPRLAGSR